MLLGEGLQCGVDDGRCTEVVEVGELEVACEEIKVSHGCRGVGGEPARCDIDSECAAMLRVLDCVLEGWLTSATGLQRGCRLSGRSVGGLCIYGRGAP